MKKMRFDTKQLVIMALMVAMDIVLTRFLSIPTPILRIGFGFLPVAVVAMMYGPISAALVAVLADIVGINFFSGATMFPGFTFSAFLVGIIYGVLMHKHGNSTFHICAAVLTVRLFVNLGFNTLWLHIITGNSFFIMLPMRALGQMIMIPIEIVLIKTIATLLISHKLIKAGQKI